MKSLLVLVSLCFACSLAQPVDPNAPKRDRTQTLRVMCEAKCTVLQLGTMYACAKIPEDEKYDTERQVCAQGQPVIDPVCRARCAEKYPVTAAVDGS